MKALLLIGGQATRLNPLGKYLPKSLLPICDRELLHYQVTQIARAGISEIVLAAGHLVKQLAEYVAQYSGGLEFSVSVEEEPMGTAGAIAQASKHLDDEPLVVLNADILHAVNIAEMIRAHNKAGRLATLLGYKVEDPSRYGLLQVAGDEIYGFSEKPEGALGDGPHFVNAGVYVLSPEAVRSIPTGRAVSIEREVFPALIADSGNLAHHPYEGIWCDIGTFESYFEANFILLARRYTLGEDGLWGERDDCAIFKDQILISRHARLGKGVDLFHRVIVMNGATIGADCTLRNVLVLPGANLGEDVEMTDCIVGPGVGIQGKTKYQNLVFVEGENSQPFFPISTPAP